MQPDRIELVARRCGLAEDAVEPFGWFKGKLIHGVTRALAARPCGKYVCVTSMSPTPLGEGKTVTAIGLSMALCRSGRRAVPTLRQPSLAPLFGVKGGGAGGGRALLVPPEEVNLHLTGDLHAVAAAANLLAAVVDNHVARGLDPRILPTSILVRRAVDVEDRGLRSIKTGVGGGQLALQTTTAFELVAASEVMAVLALATDIEDLRARLGRMLVGFGDDDKPIYAEDVGCAGAMAALLRDAIRPNLLQTIERTPAFVHTGPFANVSHGNSSVVADLAALRLADYVVTESGFGADCGAEKLFDIKCRVAGIVPDLAVLVCSTRAVKLHGGTAPPKPGMPLPPEVLREDLDALERGAENLRAHIDIVRAFGVPVVVAVNRFSGDSARELDRLRGIALDAGAIRSAVCNAYELGSEGALELAEAVIDAASGEASFRFLYPLEASLGDKIETLATQVYGASGVEYEPPARRALAQLDALGFGRLPVCIAKTQYSLSHDPSRLGRPSGYAFPIRDVRISSGAGFVYALAGEITTLPGLPRRPAALDIDITASGAVTGLI